MRGSSRFIRILLVLAVGIAWTLSITPGQASASTPKKATSATQVYTQTGVWAFNGRTWVTNCTPYSTHVDRCETKIWGTVVTYAAGKFTQKNQWVFNNLTYLESPRSVWETGNVLVTPGEHTVNGRKWKTECNTAWTGQGACRSQIWATVAGLKDGKYQNINMWVLNNIVHLEQCPISEKDFKVMVKDAAKMTFCLQSLNDPSWVAVQFPAKDADGADFTATAFAHKGTSGWVVMQRQTSLGARSLCIWAEEAGIPHDLADTISYCYSG